MNPSALWLLLLLPIPWLLARRRRVLKRQAVSNLYLWQDLVQHDVVRPAWRRPRRDWLTVLQTVFMALVIGALARPSIAVQPARAALVIDVSASMGARDGSGTRLDLARRRAQSILARLPRRSRVELVAAAASPRDLGDYAAGDPALARAVEGLVPTAGAADLAGAINLASVAGARGGNVYVVSDRTRGDGGTSAWEIVGHAADNLALSKLSARRSPQRTVEGQILVEVRNFGSRPRDVDVEVSQDGRAAGRETIHIPGEGRRTMVVPAERLGNVIEARLVVDDALEVDNRRFAVVPPLERVGVTLTGGGNGPLEKALAVNTGIALDRIPAGLPPGRLSEHALRDVVVCVACETVPQARRGVLMVPPSASARSAGSVPSELAPPSVKEARLDASILTIARPDHPLAASLDLAETFVTPLMPRPSTENGDVVLRAGALPVVVASEHDGRRIVEFRFDTGISELTLGTAFPVLVANAIDWLAKRNENPREIVAGEPVGWMLSDASNVRDVSVTAPDGKTIRFERHADRLTIAETDLPGSYRVRTPGADQVFVVNPSVDTESDLLHTGIDAPAAEPVRPLPLPAPFVRPIAPLLLWVACAVFAALCWFRGSRSNWRPIAIAACLILGALNLAVPVREGPVTVMAVLDRSGSVAPRAQERAVSQVNAFASTMRSWDRLGIVAFGAVPALERRPAEHLRLTAINSTVADTATDIAAALRLARAALTDQGPRRIVLLSDGRQTKGDAEREAAYLAADGTRVDVAPTGAQDPKRLTASRVVAPAEVRMAEPFVISVEVEGASGARGRLTLYRDDQPLGAKDVTVPPAGATSVAFSDRHLDAGLHTYRALVESREDDAADREKTAEVGAVVSVSGRPSVLYVASAGGSLRQVLAAAGYVVSATAPESLPAVRGALAAYDAVVLDDVPSDRVSPRQASALVSYVEEAGGGLLLLGSSRSLGLAGYPTGPLGRILPVDLRPRAGARAPSLGLVLVFDKSGSMADLAGGTPKIELARQAAMKLLEVLPPSDSLGLVAFDAAPVAIAPLAPDPDARRITERLRAIQPGGSTSIAPAVDLAIQWLHTESAAALSRRQILLVSDGRTSADDAKRLRAAIGSAGVELSVVAIGPNADRDFLGELAASTGGRAYFPDNVADLPLVVAREAVRSSGGKVVEERFAVRGAPHPVLAGIDRASLPQLGGYVVSAAKPAATSILASHLDDPILAAWRVGLGRVGVFTADLGSPWSAPLRNWSGYARLWVQSLRWLGRRSDDRSLRLAVSEDGDDARILVEAEDPDGAFLNLADLGATVRLPGGETREIVLGQSAPGRYEARLPISSAGSYAVSIAGQERDNGAEHRVVRGFFWSADRERRLQGADVGFLTRLATTTGGRLLTPADSPFTGSRETNRVDVLPWLAAAALVIFIFDLVTRREIDVRRLLGWFGPAGRAQGRRMAA